MVTKEQMLAGLNALEDLLKEQARLGEDRRRIIALYLRMRRQRQAIKRMQQAERQMELAI